MAGSKLPKGCRSDENRINSDLAKIREEFEDRHGTMGAHAAAVLHRIRRAMTRDRLAARWLRIEGDKLTIEQRLAMVAEMTAAAETIEKCLRLLRLDVDDHAASDPHAALAAFVNGGTSGPSKPTPEVREESSQLRTEGISGDTADRELQEGGS